MKAKKIKIPRKPLSLYLTEWALKANISITNRMIEKLKRLYKVGEVYERRNN